MPYAVIAMDKEGGAQLRPSASRAPRAERGQAAGGAIFADDGTTPIGSLLIIDAEDRAEAEAIIAADPFTKGGLFQSVAIHPWRKVYLAGKRML